MDVGLIELHLLERLHGKSAWATSVETAVSVRACACVCACPVVFAPLSR